MVEDLTRLPPLGKSDHVGLLWKYRCYNEPVQGKGKIDQRDFWQGNYDGLKADLNEIDWKNELQGCNIEQAWKKLKQRLNDGVNKHIPLKKPRKERNKPGWMTKRVLRSVKQKYHLYKKYEQANTEKEKARQEYIKQRNETNKLIRQAKEDYDKNLIVDFKDKPKKFYAHVRRKQKVRSGVGQLEKEDGSFTSNDEETAAVLSEFFNLYL